MDPLNNNAQLNHPYTDKNLSSSTRTAPEWTGTNSLACSLFKVENTPQRLAQRGETDKASDVKHAGADGLAAYYPCNHDGVCLWQWLPGTGIFKGSAKTWNRLPSRDVIKNLQLGEGDAPNTVHISTYGDESSEMALFPEYGIPLHQTPIDRGQYEQAFDALPANEKLAVRVWTLMEDDTMSYNDGCPNLTLLGLLPINTGMNEQLRRNVPLDYWSQQEKIMYQSLLNAFNCDIPTQHGSYLRAAEYKIGQYIPWADTISPGDIVTNYPAFMSVSAQDTYARLFVMQVMEDAIGNREHIQALIFYKIENARQCMPLLYGIASTSEMENEYLYHPKSFFRVKGISTCYAIEGDMEPGMRIAVVLEELEHHVASAKNLFSGAVVENFLSPSA